MDFVENVIEKMTNLIIFDDDDCAQESDITEKVYKEEAPDITENQQNASKDEAIDLLETPSNVLQNELFLQMLDTFYPKLRDSLLYCAPEIYWLRVKQCTGIDINELMQIYNEEDRKCESCQERNENNLKTKLREMISSKFK